MSAARVDTESSAAQPPRRQRTSSPPTGSRTRPEPGLGTWAGLAAGAGTGLVWGAATSLLQTVLPGSWNWLANAASPWVAAAFVVGLLVRRWPAAAGLLVCLGEVAGYYGLSALRGFPVGSTWVLVWAAAAVLGGPVFAGAGWLWRRSTRLRWGALGAALLPVVFLAEGAVLHGWVLGHTGVAVLLCSIGAALLVLVALVRPAARSGCSRRAGAAALAAWVLPVAAAGAAGELLLTRVLA